MPPDSAPVTRAERLERVMADPTVRLLHLQCVIPIRDAFESFATDSRDPSRRANELLEALAWAILDASDAGRPDVTGKLYWITDPSYPCPTCGHVASGAARAPEGEQT